jgi:hypothetical protein
MPEASSGERRHEPSSGIELRNASSADDDDGEVLHVLKERSPDALTVSSIRKLLSVRRGVPSRTISSCRASGASSGDRALRRPCAASSWPRGAPTGTLLLGHIEGDVTEEHYIERDLAMLRDAVCRIRLDLAGMGKIIAFPAAKSSYRRLSLIG